MALTDLVIRSQLIPPRQRRGVLRRPRLEARLADALDYPLTRMPPPRVWPNLRPPGPNNWPGSARKSAPRSRRQSESSTRRLEAMSPEEQAEYVGGRRPRRRLSGSKIQSLADQAREGALAAQRGEVEAGPLAARIEEVASQVSEGEEPGSPWEELARYLGAVVALLRGEPVPPVPDAYAADSVRHPGGTAVALRGERRDSMPEMVEIACIRCGTRWYVDLLLGDSLGSDAKATTRVRTAASASRPIASAAPPAAPTISWTSRLRRGTMAKARVVHVREETPDEAATDLWFAKQALASPDTVDSAARLLVSLVTGLLTVLFGVLAVAGDPLPADPGPWGHPRAGRVERTGPVGRVALFAGRRHAPPRGGQCSPGPTARPRPLASCWKRRWAGSGWP